MIQFEKARNIEELNQDLSQFPWMPPAFRTHMFNLFLWEEQAGEALPALFTISHFQFQAQVAPLQTLPEVHAWGNMSVLMQDALVEDVRKRCEILKIEVPESLGGQAANLFNVIAESKFTDPEEEITDLVSQFYSNYWVNV